MPIYICYTFLAFIHLYDSIFMLYYELDINSMNLVSFPITSAYKRGGFGFI